MAHQKPPQKLENQNIFSDLAKIATILLYFCSISAPLHIKTVLKHFSGIFLLKIEVKTRF